MKTQNAKTQDTGGRREDRQRANERKRLGQHGEDSPVYGLDSLGTSPADSSGENYTWLTNHQGNDNPGKILERLELIEKTFLSYVQGHQQRLETRLEESKVVETVFREEVQALKQEIYHLTAKPEE
ncbi:hypothetical protein WDZ92_11180 [Nostoc sp. NIES-2111]